MYARDHATFATPIGRMTLIGDGAALRALSIATDELPRGPTTGILKVAIEQLEQWFAGERQNFALPLVPLASSRGEALRRGMIDIGYGETLSYGGLARQLSSSPRAIGQACARNPLPIIVPCHRVLAAGNVLGAYSGGEGPVTKAWLLAHEQRHRPDPSRLI